jgi:hypothetical protein
VHWLPVVLRFWQDPKQLSFIALTTFPSSGGVAPLWRASIILFPKPSQIPPALLGHIYLLNLLGVQGRKIRGQIQPLPPASALRALGVRASSRAM